MASVNVTVADGSVTLFAPYDPTMPSKARAIGGKWLAASKAWRFDARDEPRVRDLAREIYGTDGAATSEPTVTVRVDACSSDPHRFNREIRIAGQRLVHRSARDVPVRLEDGVVIVKGGFPASGGSVKNPRLETNDDTVLEIRDVPLSVAQKMIEEGYAEIVSAGAIDRESLLRERERLIARLAELDAALDQ